jgi:hypothetical protein
VDDFIVEVYWSQAATTSEMHAIDVRNLALQHTYTPEELDFEGNDLLITVFVYDGDDTTSQTLIFREGEPAVAERPDFAPRPQETPPERSVTARVQTSGTTSQIVSAEFGRAATQGTQTAPALHQFVLRVVGPDGEESGSYPLPAEALADLPEFLTTLGVPDGHYRVYLVTGDLERLVIDGHLRAGRIVDPNDESQSGFDFPHGNVAKALIEPSHIAAANSTAISQIAGHHVISAMVELMNTENAHNEGDGDHAALASTVQDISPDLIAEPAPAAAAEPTGTAGTDQFESDETRQSLAMPIIGGAIVVSAAATAMVMTSSHRSNPEQLSRQYSKRARLARKLARKSPATAHV